MHYLVLLGWIMAIALAGYMMTVEPTCAEGTRRGVLMDVNRTGYHMEIVIGQTVSIINDVTAEECATAESVLKRRIPDAWTCCYHTAEQAKAC